MYAWVIDKDVLVQDEPEEKREPEGTYCNAPGVLGPSQAPGDLVERLGAGEGTKFRMLDDDGELYYEGRIVRHRDEENLLDMEGFEPLDDFGMPNAGCTEIQFVTEGRWQAL